MQAFNLYPKKIKIFIKYKHPVTALTGRLFEYVGMYKIGNKVVGRFIAYIQQFLSLLHMDYWIFEEMLYQQISIPISIDHLSFQVESRNNLLDLLLVFQKENFLLESSHYKFY